MKKKEETKQFRDVGRDMEESRIQNVQAVMEKFKISLAEFAEKHRKRINSDPEFRNQFHAMCVNVGVDPLASSKGFWADILGVGNFYYELGIKVIQVCLQTRSINGGIISLQDLLSRIQKLSRGKQVVSGEDVKKAVDKLAVMGSGFKMINAGTPSPMIMSVPLELNQDHMQILMAGQASGEVTLEAMQLSGGVWSVDRFMHAINPLLQEGIVWVDEYEGKGQYLPFF